MSHADHPGHLTSCELQITVTPPAFGGHMSSDGYACSASGGHCVPGDYCEERRKFNQDQDDVFVRLVDVYDYNSQAKKSTHKRKSTR